MGRGGNRPGTGVKKGDKRGTYIKRLLPRRKGRSRLPQAQA